MLINAICTCFKLIIKGTWVGNNKTKLGIFNHIYLSTEATTEAS